MELSSPERFLWGDYFAVFASVHNGRKCWHGDGSSYTISAKTQKISVTFSSIFTDMFQRNNIPVHSEWHCEWHCEWVNASDVALWLLDAPWVRHSEHTGWSKAQVSLGHLLCLLFRCERFYLFRGLREVGVASSGGVRLHVYVRPQQLTTATTTHPVLQNSAANLQYESGIAVNVKQGGRSYRKNS